MKLEIPVLEKKTENQINPKLLNIFYLLIGITFLVFSFWNALFFEKSIMTGSIYIFILTVLISIWLQKTEVSFKGLTIADYLVLSYFGVYFLSSLLSANIEYAVIGSIQELTYLFLYFIVRIIVSLGKNKSVLINYIILSGTLFGLYGLANGFGTLNVFGTIDDSGIRRMSSNFEYPNSFAIYQGVVFILSLVSASLEQNKVRKLLFNIANYTLIISVILSYSRGTWVVLAGMVVIALIFLPKMFKGQFFATLINLGISISVTLPLITKAFLTKSWLLGWSAIIVGIIVIGILIWISSLLNERLSNRSWTITLISTGFIFFVSFIVLIFFKGLPKGLLDRITSISLEQYSVVQRLQFFKDGLKSLVEYPILGAGPNAWKALYAKYQSYPYISNQSHSVMIDTLMNIGVVGFLLFILTLVLMIWTSVKSIKEFDSRDRALNIALLIALITLIFHGSIDFDFAYGTINLLMWMIFALMLPVLNIQYNGIISPKKNKTSPYQKTFVFAGITASIIGVIIAGSYLVSEKYLIEANAKGTQPEIALKDTQNATSLAPYRSTAWLERAKFEEITYKIKNAKEFLNKIKASAKSAVHVAPHDPEVLIRAAGYLGNYGGGLEAVDVARQAWENGHYRIKYPEQYIVFSDIAGTYLYQKDKEKAKMYFVQTLDTYYDIEKRIKGFNSLPSVLNPEYPYDLTPAIRLNAGESAFYLGKYDDAQKMLDPILEAPNKEVQSKAKIITATIQGKLGKEINTSYIVSTLKDEQLKKYYEYLQQITPLK